MAELFDFLFHPLPNGVMTVLTGVSLLYWLFALISGSGFDLGTDADLDVDGMGDVHDVSPGSEDADVPDGFLDKALDFINVGKAPLMVIITLFKFIGWIITISTSFFVSLAKFGYWSLLILIPVFIVTYFIMHWITKPIAKFYESIGYHGEESHDYLGRTGVMRSTISDGKIGSLELKVGEDVIRLNVKSYDGSEIKYNDDVIVIDETKEQNIYLVKKEINIHNIKN
ncbi:YqiJ family protein [Chryseobacterium oryctis]|uniref:YqiJ family protein n=1 Tax=Chryseobacterium oryctis TaxID=2952618 RepID=A0ABT3HL39_9FLAO|nr:YqiJ family protein [Chryseobacterium oryctis]MCW3160502.1 YqiJ family protein [Chryseobacterium oryctis]